MCVDEESIDSQYWNTSGIISGLSVQWCVGAGGGKCGVYGCVSRMGGVGMER
jgi:hypothetical protein